MLLLYKQYKTKKENHTYLQGVRFRFQETHPDFSSHLHRIKLLYQVYKPKIHNSKLSQPPLRGVSNRQPNNNTTPYKLQDGLQSYRVVTRHWHAVSLLSRTIITPPTEVNHSVHAKHHTTTVNNILCFNMLKFNILLQLNSCYLLSTISKIVANIYIHYGFINVRTSIEQLFNGLPLNSVTNPISIFPSINRF